MAFEQTDTTAAPASGQQAELMLSAVLHLMSHYHAHCAGSGPCPKLASTIERHLQLLSGLPNLAPVLRATCQQLSQQWALMVEPELPVPDKISPLERLARLLAPRRATPLAH